MHTFSNQAVFTDTQPFCVNAPSAALADYRLAVKDLFDIKGIATSAGNPDWLRTHALAKQTNSCVDTLLSNGAKYVGKTLTDELAYSLNGQNIHYPTLSNPITPERIPGGSSSGSAVAVAASLADIGLGTDTGGSIRVPASYNGLFGLRPTHGQIATDNMCALAPSFDTVGWLTRDIQTMRDTACVMFGAEQLQSPQTPRLAVIANLVDKCEHKQHIDSFFDKLPKSNNKHQDNDAFSIINLFLDPDQLAVSETFRILQGFEIWQQHGKWIEDQKPRFAKDIADRFAWCKTINQKQQHQALQQQKEIKNAIQSMFCEADILVIPTTPGKAPLIKSSANDMLRYREDLMSLTGLAGLTGLPQLHIPLFMLDGVPCGISLIGKQNSELQLIYMAERLSKLA